MIHTETSTAVLKVFISWQASILETVLFQRISGESFEQLSKLQSRLIFYTRKNKENSMWLNAVSMVTIAQLTSILWVTSGPVELQIYNESTCSMTRSSNTFVGIKLLRTEAPDTQCSCGGRLSEDTKAPITDWQNNYACDHVCCAKYQINQWGTFHGLCHDGAK